MTEVWPPPPRGLSVELKWSLADHPRVQFIYPGERFGVWTVVAKPTWRHEFHSSNKGSVALSQNKRFSLKPPCDECEERLWKRTVSTQTTNSKLHFYRCWPYWVESFLSAFASYKQGLAISTLINELLKQLKTNTRASKKPQNVPTLTEVHMQGKSLPKVQCILNSPLFLLCISNPA